MCSRLAASWFCERSDSVRPRTDVELPGDRLQLGVVAQGDHRADLAAVPSAAGAVLTTSTRSSVR